MSKGYCTWTYHAGDSTRPAGYWTVVSHCNAGAYCSAWVAPPSPGKPPKPLLNLEVEHNDFVTKVTAEWTSMTSAQSAILNRTDTSTDDLEMPCV